MNARGLIIVTAVKSSAYGALAWAALESANPPCGLVISDWNLPNLSRLDLLKKVRADQRFKSLPFVLVTVEAEQHEIVEAVKACVSDDVVKPFTAQTLREKLEAAHKKHTV